MRFEDEIVHADALLAVRDGTLTAFSAPKQDEAAGDIAKSRLGS
jgi:hypothetical protein